MTRASRTAAKCRIPSLAGKRNANLEIAIGREVRAFRRKLDMTVAELARQAALSAGECFPRSRTA